MPSSGDARRGGKKGRKVGRNKTKCERYRAKKGPFTGSKHPKVKGSRKFVQTPSGYLTKEQVHALNAWDAEQDFVVWEHTSRGGLKAYPSTEAAVQARAQEERKVRVIS